MVMINSIFTLITVYSVACSDSGKIDKLFSRAPEIKKEFLKPTRSSIRLMLQFMVTSSQILEVEAIQVDKDDMRFRSPVYLSWTSETLFLIGKNTTGCIAGSSASLSI